jgi:hypothetical protein
VVPPTDAVTVRLDGPITLNLYGNDPLRSLTLRPLGDIRAEIGATFTVEVIGVQRVIGEGVNR